VRRCNIDKRTVYIETGFSVSGTLST